MMDKNRNGPGEDLIEKYIRKIYQLDVEHQLSKEQVEFILSHVPDDDKKPVFSTKVKWKHVILSLFAIGIVGAGFFTHFMNKKSMSWSSSTKIEQSEPQGPKQAKGLKKTVRDIQESFGLSKLIHIAKKIGMTSGASNRPQHSAGESNVENLVNSFPYEYTTPTDGESFKVDALMADSPFGKDTKILRVSLQGKTQTSSPKVPKNLVLLVDTSGSMQILRKLNLLRAIMLNLAKDLADQDFLTIITYSEKEKLLLDTVSAAKQATIRAAIQGLTVQGRNEKNKGLQVAYELARKNFIPNGVNKILLFCDETIDFGFSDESSIREYVLENALGGIALSVFKFGFSGKGDRFLQELASLGKGKFARVGEDWNPQILVLDGIDAENSKHQGQVHIEMHFNPDQIESFQRIGVHQKPKKVGQNPRDHIHYSGVPSGAQKTNFYRLRFKDGFTGQTPALKINMKHSENLNQAKTSSSLVVDAVDHEFDGVDADFRFASALAGLKIDDVESFSEQMKRIEKSIDILKTSTDGKSERRFFSQEVESLHRDILNSIDP